MKGGRDRRGPEILGARRKKKNQQKKWSSMEENGNLGVDYEWTTLEGLMVFFLLGRIGRTGS